MAAVIPAVFPPAADAMRSAEEESMLPNSIAVSPSPDVPASTTTTASPGTYSFPDAFCPDARAGRGLNNITAAAIQILKSLIVIILSADEA